MNLGLEGRVALVTGGSHGIGLATAKALRAEGCRVAICARDERRLRTAADSVGAFPITCNAERAEDINRAVAYVVGEFNGLHVLVNNVGGGGRWGTPVIHEAEPEVWEGVYTKNAGAAALFTRLAMPTMRRQKWGRVVTVASIHGKEGGGRPWFTMAKAAEIALMKSLARTPYLVRDGLTFNTVAPGRIAIPGTGSDTDAAAPGFAEEVDRDLPLGRLGTAEEVAAVIVFLCSEAARLVNGACVAVDGGESRSF